MNRNKRRKGNNNKSFGAVSSIVKDLCNQESSSPSNENNNTARDCDLFSSSSNKESDSSSNNNLYRAVNKYESGNEFLEGNIVKQVAYAPDGSCLLSCVTDGNSDYSRLSVYELNETNKSIGASLIYDTNHFSKHFGGINSYCWYPGMNSNAPETCAFASVNSGVGQSVLLWDAYEGNNLRAVYKLQDEHGEITQSCNCVKMNKHQLFAGLKSNELFEFELSKPGVARKHHKSIPGGMISSMELVNQNEDHLLLITTFSGGISMLDRRIKRSVVESIVAKPLHCGIVQCVSPSENSFWVAGRGKQAGLLLNYDRRYLSSDGAIGRIERDVVGLEAKNQAIGFDVDVNTNCLVSGGVDCVNVYNLSTFQREGRVRVNDVDGEKKVICHGVSIDKSLHSITSLRVGVSTGTRNFNRRRRAGTVVNDALVKSKEEWSESDSDSEQVVNNKQSSSVDFENSKLLVFDVVKQITNGNIE